MPSEQASAIKLYIVTDNPARALMAALCCIEIDRPDWCMLVTEPHHIDRLPDGCRAVGLWYCGRGRSLAERAWRDRRAFGGIVGLSDEDMGWIADWIERRQRQERQLALTDMPRRAEVTEIDDEPAPTSAITHIPAQVRNMPLSQRWT